MSVYTFSIFFFPASLSPDRPTVNPNANGSQNDQKEFWKLYTLVAF